MRDDPAFKPMLERLRRRKVPTAKAAAHAAFVAREQAYYDDVFRAEFEERRRAGEPAARARRAATVIARETTGGFGVNEGDLMVVGLLQSAVVVPDFTAPGDLIWVVRVSAAGESVLAGGMGEFHYRKIAVDAAARDDLPAARQRAEGEEELTWPSRMCGTPPGRRR